MDLEGLDGFCSHFLVEAVGGCHGGWGAGWVLADDDAEAGDALLLEPADKVVVEVGGDSGTALAGMDGDAEEFGTVRKVHRFSVPSPTRLTPDLERLAPGGGLGEGR